MTPLLIAALLALLASAALGVAAAVMTSPRTVAADGPDTPSLSQPGAALRGFGHVALLAAFGVLLAALVVRAAVAGHAPWSNLHEVTQAFAAFLLGSYLVAERRFAIRTLAPLVALLAAGLVAVALQLPDEVIPLAPALQSPLLLTVHVGAAVLAYAVSGLAFAAAVGEIAQGRSGNRVAMLPPAATCRTLAYRCVLVAFPILTAAIALGSVWANMAWRSYWNNDPKELAAAGTWLLYAAYLHVAGRGDRAGSAAPWLLVAGFGAVLLTFLGASLLFPGQHSYAGV